MIFGIVSGILTSGTVMRISGDLVLVAWAVGPTQWVPGSEVTTVNPRRIGAEFPV